MSSFVPFHAMSAQDVLQILSSSVHGLPSFEAKKRLGLAKTWQRDPPKPLGAFFVLLHQFTNPFILVLCGAAVISWFIGRPLEAFMTLGIVFVNAALGFFQEFQADRAFFALKQYLPKTVTVRRDGRAMSLLAHALVPGDIMILHAGQNILADGRIVKAAQFAVLEAALSGESGAVEKMSEIMAKDVAVFDRRNMVYAGTSVMSGQATVVVTALGTQTEFGKIDVLTANVINQETPLAQEIKKLSRFLTVGILALAFGILLLSLGLGIDLFSALMIAAALAIAAIPEGLPMTITVLLSAAMRRMLKRGVLVRHLVATEALGAVNVLCIDKTGTLTTGAMTVVEVRNIDSVLQRSDVLQSEIGIALSALASIHRESGNAAFAGAATASAIAAYVDGEEDVLCSAILPFDPAHRFSACRINASTTYVLGASDVLISKLVRQSDQSSAHNIVDEMASQGLRVVLLGVCKTEGTLHFASIDHIDLLACIGIEDPLRPSVPGAIARAANAGIRTIIITGDHPETAKTIGAQAFDHRALLVMTGEELSGLSQKDRLTAVQKVDVFARMLPEQKLLVVDALHSQGFRVAMTGDGVNDAPALKAADVGIAVGHATEVAKESADLVLLDGDFEHIVHAVEEGRTVFANAQNVTIFLLALGLGETFCIVVSFAFGLSLPLSALLILWLNVITDGIPAIFFAFEGSDPSTMKESPRGMNDGILSSAVRRFFLSSSIILLMFIIGAFFLARSFGLSATELSGATYLGIGLLGLLFIFVTKSLRTSFLQNILQPSKVRIGAIIGLVCLFLPLSLPPLRLMFGIDWPSLQTIGIVGILLFILIFILDFLKLQSMRNN